MQPLEHYTREMKNIANDASKSKGRISGGAVAWAMMWIGVVVTGTMTYALTRKGMTSSMLWASWVSFAALLPVALLEGSAVALVYGRHHWFRSNGQRRLANVSGWVIWGLLAATSVVHFAFGKTQHSTMTVFMNVYASYILPLVIVGAPMLWKRLYDAAPESETRVAVLESEAELRAELVAVQREQNALMIEAYRDSLNTPRVTQARAALFEQASIEHAKTVVGFIEGAEAHANPHSQSETPTRRVWLGNEDVTEARLAVRQNPGNGLGN